GASGPEKARPSTLPGTRHDLFCTIQGNARNLSNGAGFRRARMRLRDVRLGRIVDTTTTDESGAFVFDNVDTGSYVVEVLGKDEVLAASTIINVTAGGAATTVVSLLLRDPKLTAILGAQTPGTMGANAASSVLNVVKAAEGVAAL